MASKKVVEKVAETALATVAPEALLAEVIAKKGAVIAADILTGDIAVVRVAYPRGTKKKPLPPVLVEYHVNLVSIGLGAFLIALAAVGVSLAWNGIRTLGGGWTGLKDSRPTLPMLPGGRPPPPPPGGTNPLLCGPKCIAMHLLDPWNIAACTAECLAGR